MPDFATESSNVTPPDGIDPLVLALSALKPATPTLDVQRLTYLAGQASRTPILTFWRVVAGLQTLMLFVAIGMMLWQDSAAPQQALPATNNVSAPAAPVRSEPFEAPKVYPNTPPRESQPAPTGEFAGDSEMDADDLGRYLRIRREVLTAGLGLLPEEALPPRIPAAEEFERSLQLPPGVLAVPDPSAVPKKK